ncbi:MAG: (2Fe-2S)-binding protein, partial [Thermoplasmata archaeon]
TVNNRKVRLFVEASETLLYVLRNRLNLHGTKEGCSKGECGACTVLVNKEPVCSCITFALSCQGANILTIEGLQENGTLHPLQQAFIDAGAVQCGFCTPGMIMSAYALLMKNTNPKESEIKEALAGNLCRCTGYAKIIKAVTMAAPYFSRINLTNNSQKSSSAGGGSHL